MLVERGLERLIRCRSSGHRFKYGAHQGISASIALIRINTGVQINRSRLMVRLASYIRHMQGHLPGEFLLNRRVPTLRDSEFEIPGKSSLKSHGSDKLHIRWRVISSGSKWRKRTCSPGSCKPSPWIIERNKIGRASCRE